MERMESGKKAVVAFNGCYNNEKLYY